jgi:uncharacterized membrane protein YjgN (DUF898 family)
MPILSLIWSDLKGKYQLQCGKPPLAKSDCKMILAIITIQVLAILVSSHVWVRYNNLLLASWCSKINSLKSILTYLDLASLCGSTIILLTASLGLIIPHHTCKNSFISKGSNYNNDVSIWKSAISPETIPSLRPHPVPRTSELMKYRTF